MSQENKKNILLVEDEALIAMAEKMELEKAGYSVIHAINGEKSLEYADEHKIDLILMDIDLGTGIDGTVAAQRILENHDIPIAFLSSHTEPEIVEKTEGITSYGYIVKNTGKTVLLAAIKMAFRLFEAKQQIKDREKSLKNEKKNLKEHITLIEERERIEGERNKHLLELYEKLNFSQADFLDYVLEASLEITNSQFAFSGIVNDDETVMYIHRWSAGAMQNCSTIDKPIEFPLENAGIWGDCIRERRPIIINDYQKDTRESKHGTPKGHVNIERFLCVPIFHEARIVAVGAVANKVLPYDMADVDALGIIYDKMWSLLSQQKAERQLKESEQKWRSLVENNPDFIAIHDDSGRFLYLNRFAEGFSHDEVIGKSAYNYMDEESGRLFQQKEKECLETWSVQKFEHQAVGHKGGFAWYENFLVPYIENDTEKRIIVISRDISRRKLLHQELRENARNAHITLNSIGDAVISTDKSGNVKIMNSVAERLTGWSMDDAKGKRLDEIFFIIKTEDRERAENPVNSVLQTGDTVNLSNSTTLISKEGKEYQIADSAAPIKDEENNIHGVVLVFRDVTEEYQRKLQLRERVKELDCLYKIAEIVEESNTSLEYILRETASIIPESWQYPETCECRITLDAEIFQSDNFVETKWSQRCDIKVDNIVRGSVVVCYLDERPAIDEGPFLKEERRLIDAVAKRLGRVIERIQIQESLHSIKWMLSNKSLEKTDYLPEYGDISELNKNGLILKSVGKVSLKNISSEYLDLLETSTAIYEKDGGYAIGIFTSGWCQLMDCASQRLCRTDDNEKAIKSGKWLCHESCWNAARRSIEEGKPVDIKCHGGIRIYAVPIRVNEEIVGAINIGYGDPPTEESELKKISLKYQVPISELKKQAAAYKPRPQFIIDYAKERVQIAAETLSSLIETKRFEEILKESESKFKSIFNMSKGMIGIADINTATFKIINPAFTEVLGYTEDELLSRPFIDFVHPDDKEATIKIVEEKLREGCKVIGFTNRYRCKDNTYKWIDWSSSPVPEKGITYAVGNDITEIKEAEEAVNESEEKFRALYDKAPLPYQSLNEDGCFIDINPMWLKTLGYESTEVIGKWFGDFLHPDYVNHFRKNFPEFKKRGSVSDVQFKMRKKDGTHIDVSFEGRIGYTSDNKFKQTYCVFQDITEQKKAEKVIQHQLIEKDILLTEVHHRIKNNIMNIESLLTSQSSLIKNQEACNALMEAASRVSSMRILYDKLLLNEGFKEISAKDYVENIIKSQIEIFSLNNEITIKKEITDFPIDSQKAVKIGIIINELLTNAVKYAFRTQCDAIIFISIEKFNNELTLIIQDNGVGIDERILESKSTGFGMKIVKMIIEQLNGTLSIEKEQGTKTVIQFEI